MKTEYFSSPTIESLQGYLAQLQTILHHRQETVAVANILNSAFASIDARVQRDAEMAARLKIADLHSVDARAQRDIELERTRLKVMADFVAALDSEQHKIAATFQQQEEQINKLRHAAESQQELLDNQQETVHKKLTEYKFARTKEVSKLLEIQSSCEVQSKKQKLNNARAQLQKWLELYDTHLTKMPKLRAEIQHLLASKTTEQNLLAGWESVTNTVQLLPAFVELMSILEFLGVEKSQATQLIQPDSFETAAKSLSDYIEKIKLVPEVGLSNWQPIQANGQIAAPWLIGNPPVAWRDVATGSLWKLVSASASFNRREGIVDIQTEIDLVQKQRVAGNAHWRLPSVDELSEIRRYPHLDIIGVTKEMCAWADYSTAPNIATAFHFSNGIRATTPRSDVYALLLIAN